jgi:putative ABC transport system permease protein
MTRLFTKLAFAGLRRRKLQAALTVLVVAAAAGALTIALGIDRVADKPWERTFEATNGAHVGAFAPQPGVDLSPIEHLPGVVESTGVLQWISSSFRHDGKLFGLMLYGGAADPPSVSRPLVEDGNWPVRPGEVALERSFARFLGFHVGDTIVAGAPRQNQTTLRVTGIVVVAKGEAYPQSQPGNAFALDETLARIAPDRESWAHYLGVRIADPEASGAFLARVHEVVPSAFVGDWQGERADAKETLLTVRIVLDIFGVLLFLAGGFVLATLIGGRVLAQVREIGVLKAAGLTPGQVARVFLTEQLVLGVAGAVAGIVLGTLATPLFVSSSAALLNASEVPPFDLRSAAIVLGIAVAAVAVFTLGPSLKTGRRTTGSILAGTAAGARRSRLAPYSLPLPLALGLRDAFVRPERALLTTLALALTVASATATLGMEASFDVGGAPQSVEVRNGLPTEDPVNNDAAEESTLRPVVYGLDAVLLFVGGVNLLATVLLGLRERVRDLGLLKAVGLTPRQVTGTFIASQSALAVGAVVIGIPLGLAIFRWAVDATGGGDEFAYPAWWWLALLAPAVVAIVAALSAPLARRASALSVVDALRYE